MRPRSAAALALILCGPLAAQALAQEPSAAEACRREVVELHRFLEEWSRAELPDTDAAFARFDRAIAPDFTIVSPSGEMSERAAIVAAVRGSHGRWRDGGGRIEITGFRFHAASGDLVICSYQEWHRLPQGDNGRLSSAVLRRDPEASAGLAWVHLSEVWLTPPPGPPEP